MGFLRKQSPGRLITLGFALMILLGTMLLLLPCSVKKGVEVTFLDALFTSTSAVCVTGLLVVDVADSFTAFGQGVVAVLIQIGGLGVSSIGVGLILAAGKRISIKDRLLVREAMNVDSSKGIVRLVRSILFLTLCFEGVGALLCFFVFRKNYSFLHAAGISIFHSIAAFNNAGIDIFGGMQSMVPYQEDIFLNVITCVLIIAGGLGFFVILDMIKCKNFKKLSLHSKVVISTSAVLIIAGSCLFKATEEISWLGAVFQSVSARTAGFSTYSIGNFSNAGLFVMCILMFIGASPGSTGGGIKTSTFFTVIQAVRCVVSKKRLGAFCRSIPEETMSKAYMIVNLSLVVVFCGIFSLCVLEPEFSFAQIMFEVVSAFGTAGLSTGITSGLGVAGRMILIILMFIGRLGAFTLLSIWINRPEKNARYTEESLPIG
ncbi:MAG: H(+)-transporting ATPase [Lachnospiraceae bacterium]|nr:H(+)-transporting ATPase [Lachnospiraceae bacterium]